MKVKIFFLMFAIYFLSFISAFSQQPELTVPIGHTHVVSSVAFSPDGKYALSGSMDKTLKLWDINSGKELKTLSGHTDVVYTVAFSPDGKYALSGSSDKTLKLWDINSGKELIAFTGHTGVVYSVTFSPDGKYALSGSWDSTLKLWDINSGKEVKTFLGHTGWVWSVAFSHDGQYALSGSRDMTLKLWDINSGKEVKTFSGHTKGVYSVAFSDDGQYVLSGSRDSTLKLWDINSGKEVKTFSGYTNKIISVAFSPGGKYILSGSDDRTLKLWDINSGEVVKTFSGNNDWVISVTFSLDGQFALTGSFKTIKLWDINSGKVIKSFSGHSSEVSSVAFSHDGKYILSGSDDGTLKLWDINSGKEIKTFSGHNSEVSSVAFSSDDKYALSGSWDSTLKLWDLNTGKELKTFSGHISYVNSVAFSFDGKYALSGSSDSTLKLWDINSGKVVKTFSGHTKEINSVAFSSDGKYALSGSSDSTLKLWDINSGKEVRTFLEHTDIVNSVTFSPDSKYALSGGWDNILRLWDINSGKEIKTFLGHTSHVNSVTFSPDGKYALSVGWDNILRLWDISTGKEIRTFTGHSGWVYSVAFSPDGKYALSVGGDNKIKLWDIESGKELASLISLDSTDWAIVTQDGHFDASPGAMKLMYWVVGMETIDLEQLKERYYEPGLLQKVMGYNPEPIRDVKGFNDIKLFPEIKVTPPEGKDKYLRIELTDRGGGIGKVKVLINGKELTADARGVDDDFDPDIKNLILKVDISKSPYLLPGTDNKIEVYVFNAEGYLSSRAIVVHYIPEGGENIESPSFYAVVIGISDYEGDKLKLRYASKDAEDFSNALKIGAGRLFSESKTHVTTLSTSNTNGALLPTKENIINIFESLKNVKQNDVLVVYLAGHGVNLGSGSENEDFYYLTKEARTGNLEDPDIRKMTSISSRELTDLMLKIPALKQVLILDVCGSGKIVDKLSEKRDIPSSQIRAFERMKDRAGLNILSGCAADAVSYEASKYAQGLLTYSLLMGIKGGAVKDDGFIDVSRLFRFSEDEVPKLASNIGGIQQPKIFGSASFDIGIVTGEDKRLIPLSSAKPLILQSRFQDAKKFIDHLGIEKKVNELLMQLSYSIRDSKMVFIDASEFPDAYSIVGQYSVNNNDIYLDVKIFKGQDEKKEFKTKGDINKIDDFVRKIIEEAEKSIIN